MLLQQLLRSTAARSGQHAGALGVEHAAAAMAAAAAAAALRPPQIMFSSAANPGPGTGRLALGLLQEELAALSIPATELGKLASTPLSDAALTAWALARTQGHPAADKAAAARQRLVRLLAKLEGSMLRQQAADTSPTAQLLWQVAVAAARQQVRDMPADELQQCVEHQAVQAMLRLVSQQQQQQVPAAADVLAALEQHLPSMTDTSPRSALGRPGFWRLVRACVRPRGGAALVRDLSLTAYQLEEAADAAQQQLTAVQQLVGLDAARLQTQLLSQAQLSPNLLLPESRQALVAAVGNSKEARSLLGQLQLLEVLAAALGLSSVQLTLPVSSCELVRRLTSMGQPAPALSTQLEQALQAARPALIAAVQQLPPQALAQPSVAGLMQLLASKPQLQALGQALTAWRAEAAAAGSLPILTTLSQAEVAALTKSQAEAVARTVMRLEAAGRLRMRQAAAGQLQLQELQGDVADAAALAWKAHTGGAAGAEELVQLLLAQAAEVAGAHHAELDAAERAVASLAAGFELEEVTSRRSTAAPPSAYVMAGIPQAQARELSQEMLSSSSSSRQAASTSPLDAAETLVCDLALLLTPPGDPTHDSYQAAVSRLSYVAPDLPSALGGPLGRLLAAFAASGDDAVVDAAAVAAQQQQLRAFAAVVADELPKLLAADGGGSGPTAVAAGDAGWAGAAQLSGASKAASAGLLELLGEQDSIGVLQHASQRLQAKGEGGEQAGRLYDWLADVHADLDMQRYLQIEFDPAQQLDLVHAPRGWRDPELWSSPADFVAGMRPLLDGYLAAHGEAPLHDLEWSVHADAALAEAQAAEAADNARRRAAGHSPFHNSRADEAFLVARLDAGLPRDSVLHAAAHKYLAAACANRTWRFAQRRRLVDLLVAIGEHLAAHPARSHRGSPFSALFQEDGPPLVPRVSRSAPAPGRGRAARDEVPALPSGFGAAVQQ